MRYTPFALKKEDGIVEHDERRLAGDPSVVIAYPNPPGETFFHVDNLKDIRPFQKLTYTPESANDPVHIRRTLAELHQAHRQIKLFRFETEAYWKWAKAISKLERQCMEFYTGHQSAKAICQVQHVETSRNLVVVTEPFGLGLKPRVMGAVFRVTGFTESAIDEIGTDRLHKKAKEIYGTGWESEFIATGKFPDLK